MAAQILLIHFRAPQEMLVDWPEEEEGEDWSALEADGWISMDAILVRACMTREAMALPMGHMATIGRLTTVPSFRTWTGPSGGDGGRGAGRAAAEA